MGETCPFVLPGRGQSTRSSHGKHQHQQLSSLRASWPYFTGDSAHCLAALLHVLFPHPTERTKAQILATFPCQTLSPLRGSLGLLAMPSRINQAKPHQAHTFTSPAAPHLFEGQQHELLCLGHLHEVLEDVLVGRLEEVAAGVRVGKAPDPQAVGWVELAQEELAASIPHTIQLKQAGSGKKCLAVEKNGEKRSFQGKETPFSPSSHCRSMAEEV